MGFPRSARTSNDRGGCPLYPGDDGAHPDWPRSPARIRCFSAARPCTPPRPSIHARLRMTRHQRGFKQFTRPVFPSPVAPGWNESLGLSPELRTPPSRATHVGEGTGHRARTQNNALCHRPASKPASFTRNVRPRVALADPEVASDRPRPVSQGPRRALAGRRAPGGRLSAGSQRVASRTTRKRACPDIMCAYAVGAAVSPNTSLRWVGRVVCPRRRPMSP
jgi:hypothetical protein